MSKTIAVLGAGPAGLEAADAAASRGADVKLIDQDQPGGRAGWSSLLPSKVLLHACKGRDPKRRASPSELGKITRRIHTLAERYNRERAREVERQGVELVEGYARFLAPQTLEVTPTAKEAGQETFTVDADAVVVATGSQPSFPEGLEPDGGRVIAPRHVKKLEFLPKSMLVVGGGVSGVEFAYAFNALGVDVTWIVDERGVLPRFDKALSRAMRVELARQGICLLRGRAVETLVVEDGRVSAVLVDGEEHWARRAFVAVGRQPDMEGLALDNAGLHSENGALAVDDHARTRRESIFAAGDVTGGPMTANRAMTQGRVAGLTAATSYAPRLVPESWVKAVYTHPQVAQVGTTPDLADERRDLGVASLDLSRELQPLIESDQGLSCGELHLVHQRGDQRRIVGATAFARSAAELLSPVALAIREQMSVEQLTSHFAAHPTLGEAAFRTIRQVA